MSAGDRSASGGDAAHLKKRTGPFFALGQFCDRYKICKTLGQGTFGETVLVEDHADKSLWAAKVQHVKAMDHEDHENFMIECSVLQALPSHRNICWTREVYRSAESTHIIFELLTGGELFDRVVQKDHFTEAEAIVTMKQITSALQVVHSIGVVHRDLKPENILYANMSMSSPVKLVDFGLSAYHVTGVDDLLTKPCGTASYAAPEVLQCVGYDQKADIWSLGVISYILLSGIPPFDDDDESELLQQVLRGQVSFEEEEWDDVSALAKDFISTLMDADQHRRPNAEQVLTHRWLAQAVGGTSSSRKPSLSVGVPDADDNSAADVLPANKQWASSPLTKPLPKVQSNIRKLQVSGAPLVVDTGHLHLYQSCPSVCSSFDFYSCAVNSKERSWLLEVPVRLQRQFYVGAERRELRSSLPRILKILQNYASSVS